MSSRTLNIATDKELIDFVDRHGVQTHAARAGGSSKIIGWYCWLPHPRPFVRFHGSDWRTAVGNLHARYKDTLL
jgi:hypothetical protein